MKKTICDICGKDCSDEVYKLPYNNLYYIEKHGLKIKAFSTLEGRNFNLCDGCKIHIAKNIDIMIDAHKSCDISIKWEDNFKYKSESLL